MKVVPQTLQNDTENCTLQDNCTGSNECNATNTSKLYRKLYTSGYIVQSLMKVMPPTLQNDTANCTLQDTLYRIE